MANDRPWRTDTEIEAEMRFQQETQARRGRYPFVRPRAFKPLVTYSLLGTFVVFYILEFIVIRIDQDLFYDIFTIHSIPSYFDWINRPWSPITATLSHSPDTFLHLLFNSLAFFFFGPTIENVLGRNRFIAFFFVTGALSSIIQAMIQPGYALGASGAIMAVIGMSIILMPKSKMVIFPVPIPIPLWVGGIAFAVIDLLGAVSGSTGIGNFAHLSGMAVGLLFGLRVKKELEEKGLRLVGR